MTNRWLDIYALDGGVTQLITRLLLATEPNMLMIYVSQTLKDSMSVPYVYIHGSIDVLQRLDLIYWPQEKSEREAPTALSASASASAYISHAHPMRDPNYCVMSQTAKANACPFIDFIYILYIFCVKQLILFDTTNRSGSASYVRMVTVPHIMPNTCRNHNFTQIDVQSHIHVPLIHQHVKTCTYDRYAALYISFAFILHLISTKWERVHWKCFSSSQAIYEQPLLAHQTILIELRSKLFDHDHLVSYYLMYHWNSISSGSWANLTKPISYCRDPSMSPKMGSPHVSHTHIYIYIYI